MNDEELYKDISSRIMPFVKGTMNFMSEMGHGEWNNKVEKDGFDLIDYIVSLIKDKNNAGI